MTRLLSKWLGSKRPPTPHWKLDIRNAPVPRPFNRVSSSSVFHCDPTNNGNNDNINKVEPHQVTDMRKTYKILCLDGGGVRGLLSLILLKRLCDVQPTFLDNIDFICGTSAGGLSALMLCSGYTPAECLSIYRYSAPYIFSHNPWRLINPTRAKYSDKSKQEIMQYYLGDRLMGDLEKSKYFCGVLKNSITAFSCSSIFLARLYKIDYYFIPLNQCVYYQLSTYAFVYACNNTACAIIAFRLDGKKSHTHTFFGKEGWRPAIFTNMPRAEGLVEPDLDLPAWQAAMRTSAAPTYFPVFDGYTDGGIVANNPSMLAVSKAMVHHPHLNPSNIALFSLGTGYYPRHGSVFGSVSETDVIEKSTEPLDNHHHAHYNHHTHHSRSIMRADWGIKQWYPFLLDIILDGDQVTTEMAMHYLLGRTGLYHRLDPM